MSKDPELERLEALLAEINADSGTDSESEIATPDNAGTLISGNIPTNSIAEPPKIPGNFDLNDSTATIAPKNEKYISKLSAVTDCESDVIPSSEVLDSADSADKNAVKCELKNCLTSKDEELITERLEANKSDTAGKSTELLLSESECNISAPTNMPRIPEKDGPSAITSLMAIEREHVSIYGEEQPYERQLGQPKLETSLTTTTPGDSTKDLANSTNTKEATMLVDSSTRELEHVRSMAVGNPEPKIPTDELQLKSTVTPPRKQPDSKAISETRKSPVLSVGKTSEKSFERGDNEPPENGRAKQGSRADDTMKMTTSKPKESFVSNKAVKKSDVLISGLQIASLHFQEASDPSSANDKADASTQSDRHSQEPADSAAFNSSIKTEKSGNTAEKKTVKSLNSAKERAEESRANDVDKKNQSRSPLNSRANDETRTTKSFVVNTDGIDKGIPKAGNPPKLLEKAIHDEEPTPGALRLEETSQLEVAQDQEVKNLDAETEVSENLEEAKLTAGSKNDSANEILKESDPTRKPQAQESSNFAAATQAPNSAKNHRIEAENIKEVIKSKVSESEHNGETSVDDLNAEVQGIGMTKIITAVPTNSSDEISNISQNNVSDDLLKLIPEAELFRSNQSDPLIEKADAPEVSLSGFADSKYIFSENIENATDKGHGSQIVVTSSDTGNSEETRLIEKGSKGPEAVEEDLNVSELDKQKAIHTDSVLVRSTETRLGHELVINPGDEAIKLLNTPTKTNTAFVSSDTPTYSGDEKETLDRNLSTAASVADSESPCEAKSTSVDSSESRPKSENDSKLLLADKAIAPTDTRISSGTSPSNDCQSVETSIMTVSSTANKLQSSTLGAESEQQIGIPSIVSSDKADLETPVALQSNENYKQHDETRSQLEEPEIPRCDENTVYLYMSMASGVRGSMSRFNRASTILKSYGIDFVPIEITLDERAKRQWKYKGVANNKVLPAVFRDNDLKCDFNELVEANEIEDVEDLVFDGL